MQNIPHSRIPEEIRRVYTQTPVKIKSDVDFVIAIDGMACWIDTKATKDHLWNIKEYVLSPKKIHQWAKLKSVVDSGAMGGYLIWFYKLEKISWVPVQAINLALKENRFSIHPESPLVNSQGDGTQAFFRELIKWE